MVCRLADQVVTFPLGGVDARCGNAMNRGGEIRSAWHGQGELVSLLFAQGQPSGWAQGNKYNFEAKELGWLKRQPLCGTSFGSEFGLL